MCTCTCTLEIILIIFNAIRPSVAAAVSLLEGMMEVLSSAVKLETSSPQLAELYQYLCLAAPFGTPSETNPSNLKFQIQFRKGLAMPKEKVELMCSTLL